MVHDNSKYFPKPRTGKECRKVNCKRYNDYIEWRLGNHRLEFCTNCKHAHVSQYERNTDINQPNSKP
jgi:hypothetical protein